MPRAGPMRSAERAAWLPAALALWPKPALVIALNLPAIVAVFQGGRQWRLDHSPATSAVRTIREHPLGSEAKLADANVRNQSRRPGPLNVQPLVFNQVEMLFHCIQQSM